MRLAILLMILIACLAVQAAHGGGTVVDLKTNPPGFDAWISDRYLGSTPLVFAIPAGTHRLRLGVASDAIFYPPALDTMLAAVDGDTLAISLALPRFPERIISRSSVVSRMKSERERPLWRRIGRYAMPGVAAALAAGGFLAEDAADRSYDRYLRAAEPEEIRRYYRQTQDRDMLSTALWIGAETSLICTILTWVFPEKSGTEQPEGETR